MIYSLDNKFLYIRLQEVRKNMITDLYEKLLPRFKSINFDISLEEILELYNVK